MALELNGTTGVSLVQDGVVTAADLSSTLDLSGKTVTLSTGAVLLDEQSISSSVSSVDITLDSTNYKSFKLYFEGIQCTNDCNIYALADVGSGYTSATNYSSQTIKKFDSGFDSNKYGGDNNSLWYLTHNVGGSIPETWNAVIDLNVGSGTGSPIFSCMTHYRDNGGAYAAVMGTHVWQNFNVLEGFRLYPSVGTFTAGKYYLWGLK